MQQFEYFSQSEVDEAKYKADESRITQLEAEGWIRIATDEEYNLAKEYPVFFANRLDQVVDSTARHSSDPDYGLVVPKFMQLGNLNLLMLRPATDTEKQAYQTAKSAQDTVSSATE
jgi:hypothetical protein